MTNIKLFFNTISAYPGYALIELFYLLIFKNINKFVKTTQK
ncbi:MAG: hypothetical protein AB1782_11915 [Cyanobacteriota bacterium]